MQNIKIPGPGAYHQEQRPKSGGLPFGQKNTADSFLNKGVKTPGPGNYDVFKTAR